LQGIRVTKVSRFTKTQVVLENGNKYPLQVNRPFRFHDQPEAEPQENFFATRSSSAWGRTFSHLVSQDSAQVTEARQQLGKQRAVRIISDAADDFTKNPTLENALKLSNSIEEHKDFLNAE